MLFVGKMVCKMGQRDIKLRVCIYALSFRACVQVCSVWAVTVLVHRMGCCKNECSALRRASQVYQLFRRARSRLLVFCLRRVACDILFAPLFRLGGILRLEFEVSEYVLLCVLRALFPHFCVRLLQLGSFGVCLVVWVAYSHVAHGAFEIGFEKVDVVDVEWFRRRCSVCV